MLDSGRNTNKVSASQTGFSLLEVMVSLVLLLMVAGVVMSGLVQMTKTQSTVSNRTAMHSGVRSATELLQQEIGQAGKASLPGALGGVLLTGVVAAAGNQTVGVNSTAGMFNGEYLVIDAGANQETVAVTVAGNQITGNFTLAHVLGAPITVQGAFSNGIVPTAAAPANFPSGSTGTVLKLFGDINGDGNMEYVEYTCQTGTPNNPGNLYRNVVQNAVGNAAPPKPALTPAMIILPNILQNPPDPNGNAVPCFTYQQQLVNGVYYVTDVAVTLTVQTQTQDIQTNQFQTETKALLNVAPRNVFEAWELTSAGITNRVQPTPPSVIQLLP